VGAKENIFKKTSLYTGLTARVGKGRGGVTGERGANGGNRLNGVRKRLIRQQNLTGGNICDALRA